MQTYCLVSSLLISSGCTHLVKNHSDLVAAKNLHKLLVKRTIGLLVFRSWMHYKGKMGTTLVCFCHNTFYFEINFLTPLIIR